MGFTRLPVYQSVDLYEWEILFQWNFKGMIAVNDIIVNTVSIK